MRKLAIASLKEIRCPYCDREFKPRNSKTKFCSRKCVRLYEWRILKNRSMPFTSEDRARATDTKRKRLKPENEKTCGRCGKKFRVRGARRIKMAKYCSRDCRKASGSDREQLKKVCSAGGKAFQAKYKLPWKVNRTVAPDGCPCFSQWERRVEEWLVVNRVEHYPEVQIRGNFRCDRLVVGRSGERYYLEINGMGEKRYENKVLFVNWIRKMRIYRELGLEVIVVENEDDLGEKLGFLATDTVLEKGALA